MDESDDGPWVLRITGTKRVLGNEVEVWALPAYLVAYDPDASEHGQVTWLQDASKAKQYPSLWFAESDYNRESRHQPTKADGSPNAPLFDRHTVEFVRLRDALGGNGGNGNGGGA